MKVEYIMNSLFSISKYIAMLTGKPFQGSLFFLA